MDEATVFILSKLEKKYILNLFLEEYSLLKVINIFEDILKFLFVYDLIVNLSLHS
jgi:hypothetical protein